MNTKHFRLIPSQSTFYTLLFIVLFFFSAYAHAALSLFVEPEGAKRVVDLLNGAKSSIYMEMYYLSDHDIENALISAYQRGIDVKIILESNPYGGLSNLPAVDALEAGGIPANDIHWSNPEFSLTHEKAIVIDNQTANARALIMTLNMSYSSFTSNREYGIIDTSQDEIDEIVGVFINDWKASPTPNAKTNGYYFVWSPINSREKIMNLINSAKHTLFIEAELINDNDVEQALIAKADAGVLVQIVLPASEKIDLGKNVQIRYLDPDQKQLYMHAKMIIADNSVAYLGSINLSYASMNYNRELGIIFKDINIIDTLDSTFVTDWKDATPPG